MRVLDLSLNQDAAAGRDTIAAYFQEYGYTLTWQDEWNGSAETGSKVKTALLGAMSEPYMNVGVRVQDPGTGGALVRIERRNTGWMAGYFGAKKVDKAFDTLRDHVSQVLQGQGVLAGVAESHI